MIYLLEFYQEHKVMISSDFSICLWNGLGLFAAWETLEPNKSETRTSVFSAFPATFHFCTTVDGGSISIHPKRPLNPTVFPPPYLILQCQTVQVNHIYYPTYRLLPTILLTPVNSPTFSVQPSSLLEWLRLHHQLPHFCPTRASTLGQSDLPLL